MSTVAPRIFLSASVPIPSRDRAYFASADIVAIRDAIRALTMVTIQKEAVLVFGGHPAITPMIRIQIAETGASVNDRVLMFQSRYFEHAFPEDNSAFERVSLIDAVPGDREASLLAMREAMLAGDFICGLFIGGMEGVEQEYAMFRRLHPDIPAFPIASTGAAAARLFDADNGLKRSNPELRDEISYLTLMRNLTSMDNSAEHSGDRERD
jgi:SLOG cluster3 family